MVFEQFGRAVARCRLPSSYVNAKCEGYHPSSGAHAKQERHAPSVLVNRIVGTSFRAKLSWRFLFLSSVFVFNATTTTT